MRKIITSGILALLVAMLPLLALAQAPAFDEETRAIVAGMVQRVAATIEPGIATPDGDVPGVASPVPQPQPEAAESEPTEESAELPALNLTDLVEYTSQGLTFRAPADWEVDLNMGDEMPFAIEVPDTDLIVVMQSDTALDFPSWLALALFRSQADTMLASIGDDAILEESVTLYNSQNLPIPKLEFSGIEDDEMGAGAMYVVAPSENVYIIIAGGPTDDWEYARPGVELIVESLVFDEDLVTAVQATDGPMPFADDEGTVEVTVPAGWYAMSTNDPKFPVIVAEPEVRYVAAIGTDAAFNGELDAEILEEFVPVDGVLDPELEDELFETIVDKIIDSGSPIIVDEEASSVYAREGAITLRLVGEAEMDQEFNMPVVFFIDLRLTGVGAVAIFGDVDLALEIEDEIQALLESVTGL